MSRFLLPLFALALLSCAKLPDPLGAAAIHSVSPADGATDVDRATRIEVQFTEAMDGGSVVAALSLQVDGVLLGTAGSYDSTTKVLTAVLNEPLPAMKTVFVTVDEAARSVEGAVLGEDFTWSFTTGATMSTAGPVLVSSEPSDGSVDIPVDGRFLLQFDKDLLPSTALFGAVNLFVDGESKGVDVALDSPNTLAVHSIRPLPELSAAELILAPSIADMAGNAMGFAVTLSFDVGIAGLISDPPAVFGVPGDSANLTITLLNGTPVASADVVFQSGDSSTATVDSGGLVDLLASGSTQLTVSHRGATLLLPVGVGDLIAETNLSLINPQTVSNFSNPPEWDLQDFPGYPWGSSGAVNDGGGDRYDDFWELYVDGTFYQPYDNGLGEFLPSEPGGVVQDVPAMMLSNHTVLSGFSSCWFPALSGAAARQTLDLSGATTANLVFDAKWLASDPDVLTGLQGWSLEVVDAGGQSTILSLTSGPGTWSWANVAIDLSAYVGQVVELVWRADGMLSYSNPWGNGLFLDNISVLDEAGNELFGGGDCEAADPAWDLDTVLIHRERRLAAQQMDDLLVERWIYVPFEDAWWGRFLERLTNTGTDPVTVSVEFRGDLGSDDYGLWHRLGDNVWSEYDEDGDPDLGVVLGKAWPDQQEDFPNYDEICSVSLNALVIDPGQTVSLLNYVIMGDDEYDWDPAMETLGLDIENSLNALGSQSPYAIGLGSAWPTIVNW